MVLLQEISVPFFQLEKQKRNVFSFLSICLPFAILSNWKTSMLMVITEQLSNCTRKIHLHAIFLWVLGRFSSLRRFSHPDWVGLDLMVPPLHSREQPEKWYLDWNYVHFHFFECTSQKIWPSMILFSFPNYSPRVNILRTGYHCLIWVAWHFTNGMVTLRQCFSMRMSDWNGGGWASWWDDLM